MKGYFKSTILSHTINKECDTITIAIPRELSRELTNRDEHAEPVIWIKTKDPDQELREAFPSMFNPEAVMTPEQVEKLINAIPKGQSMQIDKKILVDSTQEFPGVDEQVHPAIKPGYSSLTEFMRRLNSGQFDTVLQSNMFVPVQVVGYLKQSYLRTLSLRDLIVNTGEQMHIHTILHGGSEMRREMEEHTEVFDDSKYPGITYLHPEAESYDTYEGDTRVRRIIMPVDWLESYPGSDKSYGYVLGIENSFGGLNVPHKQVLRSGAGYYIGWLSKEDMPATQTEPGGVAWIPEARDSQQYWRTRRQAEKAMIEGNYEVKF